MSPPPNSPSGGPKLTPGARLMTFTKDVVDRIAGVINPFGAPIATTQSPSVIRQREPWFGPGEPQRPIAPRPDVAGRAYDYPNTVNLNVQPRRWSGISYEMLEALADGCNLVRLAIETRKDQMSKLTWSALPRMRPGQELRGPSDPRCQLIEDFMRFPDKRLPWHTWQRMLLEEQMVYDAPSIYVRPDNAGRPWAFEIIAGKTIEPKVDKTGRQPIAPEPAYQQVIKGMSAVNYSADELIYAPRNPRVTHLYGCSQVEQIIMTVNIAIRREIVKLSYYSEGNVPEALVSVPKEWSPSTIKEFQDIWDVMLSDQTRRQKLRFVPGGMAFQQTRNDQSLQGQFDEWLARVVMYAFSLPALPFVQMQNRATADSAYESALEEGLQPMMVWFKSIMDRIIQKHFGFDDLEFVWDDIDEVDPGEQQTRDLSMIQIGVKSVDEVRAGMGLPPIGMKHAIWGIGPNGIMFVDDLVKAQQQGLTQLQPPAAPPVVDPTTGMPAQQQAGDPAFVDGGNGQASTGAPPQITLADALQGVPPMLLAAVGLGPDGSLARKVDITDDEAVQSDPLAGAAAHPQVLKTLHAVEAAHKQRTAR